MISSTGSCLQVGERGVARAEVVDRERDAELVELLEHAAGALRVADDHRLGDLELEQRRVDAARREQLGQVVEQLGVQERARAEVDRHARRWPWSRQAATWRARCRGPCLVSGVIRPVCSAIGMNSSGRISPSDGCCQRHSASAPTTRPVGDVDLRLVVQDELVVLDRAAQLAGEREALHGVPVLLGLVELGAGVVGLGDVHRDVGALQQRLAVLAVRREAGDADRGADLERQAVDLERLRRPSRILLGDVDRVLARRRPTAAGRRTRRRPGGRPCPRRAASTSAARRPAGAGGRRGSGRACR